jgi:hypothetical protein
VSVEVVSVCEGSGLCDGSGDGRKSEGVFMLLVGSEHRAARMSSIFWYVGCIDREKMKEASMSPWHTFLG